MGEAGGGAGEVQKQLVWRKGKLHKKTIHTRQLKNIHTMV